MKKVCLFLTIAVFTLVSIGFNSANIQAPGDDCDEIAARAYRVSEKYGDTQEEMNDNYFNFYWDCMDSGGHSSFEVSLN